LNFEVFLPKRRRIKLPFWSIPMIYAAASLLVGLVLPRLEYRYLADYKHGMTVAAAIAVFSSVASGMLALTGIIFSLAFLMVQFSSVAYSPRLVLWFSRDPVISHGMGIFTSTFIFSLTVLAWVDRYGSGNVPLFSTWLVVLLVIASVRVLAILVQRLTILQVSGVIAFLGKHGRLAIGEIYPNMALPAVDEHVAKPRSDALSASLSVTQRVMHTGAPMVVADYDTKSLVKLASVADAFLIMPFGLGDTVFEGDTLIEVHGGRHAIAPATLRLAVQLEQQRIFEEDPKYAIRLLVDVAIKALSPAVNDPTTAVQALDQIEDLLRRLGTRHLDVGQVPDETGTLRVVFPTPTWDDFLSLAFDEIRFYGVNSLQVMRRLRVALCDLAGAVPGERQTALRHYLEHLDMNVHSSILDSADQRTAMQQDRQGLGLTRK
jgi:uncharacterized membrane protein